jgi:hypothetical protein
MNPPPDPQPRYSIGYQARLDAETCAKLKELASSFHRKRAAILRSMMQWGLAHTRIDSWPIHPGCPLSRAHAGGTRVAPTGAGGR